MTYGATDAAGDQRGPQYNPNANRPGVLDGPYAITVGLIAANVLVFLAMVGRSILLVGTRGL